ncbi:MAG: hypothetical protein C4582_09105 [Desulfobacteraceae bacterium]|nr:MAG: hypothetical protein C4582_09105 [Desulfobacteraceae bacterium]
MAVLTISREFGSGGREIGHAVARSLSYEIVDKERILNDTRKAGTEWEQWSKELDERSPSVWERYDWSFRGFVALIQSIMLDYALRDRVVLMGRGGNFLLVDIPYALRVRIKAPIQQRIDRIMKRETVDMDTAKWLIEKTDRERSGFIRSIYGMDWDDPACFDLVFDTEKSKPDEIIENLVAGLTERDRYCNEGCRNTVRLRREVARIKAGLLINPDLFLPTLDVELEGDTVVLKGVVHNPKERDRLTGEARRLAGNLRLRYDIRYRG